MTTHSAAIESQMSSLLVKLCTYQLTMHERVQLNLELSSIIEELIDAKIREALAPSQVSPPN